ncbi:hypothetical protein AOC36_06390 [Erysipelothrix larvae]|uniref:ABC transporter permease n=1 Tax=Erysipelothrix larvae TaxID=1514105 RepID=A0A0X8H053_9FIRM|nr:putative ABC transporter permease [Erysipelothrix larvae]AMC93627.1 hypothetical protein AOC36_06390 [Erysipelothrix larvae]
MNGYQWILTFTLFSTIGWIVESVWCWAGTKKIVNRGFLSGPWCPIYGFGSVIIVIITKPFMSNPFLVFLSAVVSTSLLEYFTGWLMETLFKARWWDYSKRPFNLKGRICLRNSFLFGVLGLVVVYAVHPFTKDIIQLMPPIIQKTSAIVLVAVFIMDTLNSLNAALKIDKRIETYRATLTDLDELQEAYQWFDRDNIRDSIDRLRMIAESSDDEPLAKAFVKRIDELSKSRTVIRLFTAFPILESKSFYEGLDNIIDDLLRLRKKRRK